MVDVEPEVVDKGFVLRSLRHFIDGLELDFARLAVEFHQSNQWEAEGYNSAADWMRFNCHMISYAVFCLKKKKVAGRARVLHHLDATADGWRRAAVPLHPLVRA